MVPRLREWTPADTALWHTICIAADLQRRRIPEQRVATVFPLADGEIALASGPFTMDAMRADGDGSYAQNSTLVFGTGTLGVAMMAGSMIGSGVGNAARRARAAADAQVVWRPDFSGNLTVTNRGFYLGTNTGLHFWDWASISLAEIAGFTVFVMQGNGEHGPVTWRMQSDWSELVFVLWAMTVHPQHPQYVGRVWIPQNWVEWAASMGYPLPESARPLTS